MRRGLLLTIVWLSLALGFTEVLSSTFHDNQVPGVPPAAVAS
ncbi:MAG TPA: hypothetical protein VLA02_19605 [Reyranella sp.]|nr:hypothetical protein [Reyranella sp.]